MVLRRLVIAWVFVFTSMAFPSFAGPARQLDRQIGRLLETMPGDGKATLRDISLGRESLDTLEIEPMQVWASDSRIIAYGAGDAETILPPPDVKYFKGRVKGEDDSIVFFSRSADGSIRGMILLGERRWTIGTGVRKTAERRPKVRTEAESDPVDPDAPLLISEFDELDELNDPGAGWGCEVGEHAPGVPLRLSDLSARAPKKPSTDAGNVAGATYQLRLAIETDDELYTGFGSNSGALTTYIGDLIGKASIVYSRDVKTSLVLGEVHLRTGGPGTDPWTQSTSSTLLAQFGTYWHNNYPHASVPRSTAVFLSGRNLSAGIAWINVLCDDDIFCGADGSNCNGGFPSATYANAWAGGYAYNSQIGAVTTTVPDPELTVNGVQYGLPTTSNFWLLLEVMHEVGHNVASPHSSCVALSPAEQVQYGVVRGFVDLCLSSGGTCYSGVTSAPAEKGTIMSYCHEFTSGGFRQSRYLFGKAAEPSEKMLPIFNGGLEGCTPNVTITSQTPPVACSAGRTASVAACTGCTYQWTISGGTITSSTTVNAITYTPNAANVTLGVTIITARGCGITASKSFLSQCVAVTAPTNVVATATSTSNVNVSWNASAGALSYSVYRSANGSTYSLAGSVVTPTVTFNDGGRTANTAYLYKVRAVNGGESADSNIDLATTVIFTDDPLVVSTTRVKAAHFTELRTAVNAVRTLALLGAGSYTDPTITATVTSVKAVHINDLRMAIDAARSALTLAALSYGEMVTASTTTVKASHITELRNGVK